MVSQHDLEYYMNQLLDIDSYQDYVPNGLQIEGKKEIKTIVSGVTASLDLINSAIAVEADAILVHHGYFWKNENQCIISIKKHRITKLLSYNINLYAYHLPLDDHEKFGNNVQLAKRLDVHVDGHIEPRKVCQVGLQGYFNKPITAMQLCERITSQLERKPLHISGRTRIIKRLAWCTGAAQKMIEHACALEVDAFLTGEASEACNHIAKEFGIHFFAAGHHATERYGVQALGEHIASHFHLKHIFIDVPNPI